MVEVNIPEEDEWSTESVDMFVMIKGRDGRGREQCFEFHPDDSFIIRHSKITSTKSKNKDNWTVIENKPDFGYDVDKRLTFRELVEVLVDKFGKGE